MTKRYGPPSPSDVVAALMRRRGVNLDPQRLDEQVAAVRSREKADFKAHLDRVEDAAIAAKKARRRAELAEQWWRMHPGADMLAEARAAQQARNAAEAKLAELLMHDEQAIADAKRRYGR